LLIACTLDVVNDYSRRGLLKFESRVSSIKNGRIRCFLLIQLKLETRVLILETRYSIKHNTHSRQHAPELCSVTLVLYATNMSNVKKSK